MKTLLNIIFAIAALGAVISVAYFSNLYMNLRKQEINNEARFQCAQSSRYETTEALGAKVWYPVKEMYEKCLQEKGI